MKTVCEDLTARAEQAIDRAREANPQALHTSGEDTAARSFHDQVHVVALDREVDDTKAAAQLGHVRSSAHGLANDREERLLTEVREAVARAQGDVDRVGGVVSGPRPVRHTRTARKRWFSAGPRALASPGAGKREGELVRVPSRP